MGNTAILEALGKTLIDSIGQGILVLLVVMVGLWLTKDLSAKLRHNILLIGLIILPLLSVNSFISHYDSTSVVINNLESQKASIFNKLESFGNDSATLSTVEAAPNNSIIWPTKWEWLSYVWILGFIICLIRMTGSFFYLNNLNRRAEQMSFEDINHRLNSIKEGFGIKREVILKTSEKIVSPLIYGVFKPVIIFPLGLVQGLTTEEVEAILLHELSHLKRNDFIINIVINVLKTVYFYHPAFWWMSAQLDNEREFATDEMVLSQKANAIDLIKALSKTQEYQMTVPAMSFAGSSKNQLLKRVNRIMKKQQKPNWFGGLLAMFILASAFLLTSQQVKEKLDQGKELDKHTIDSVLFKDFNPKLDISARDSIKTKRFSIDLPNTDSISYQYWKAPYFTNDSLTVEKALADILKNKENFMLERLESGEITNVSKGKNELAGDSLTVYKQAFEMLDEYSDNNQKYKKQQELREYRKQYQEELKQLVSSYNELNKQEEITQIEYEKQLAEIQKQLMSASYAGQKSMDMNLEMLDYLRSLEGGADLSNEDFSTARMELQSKKMLEKMEQLKAKLGAQPDPEVEKLLNATISAYQEQLRALEKAQYQQQLALKEKVQAREKKLQQMQTQLEVQKKRAEVMIQRERLMAIQKENEAALNNQEEAVEREAEIRDKLKAIDSDMIKLSSNDNLKPLIMAVTKGSKDTLRLTDLYGIEYEQVQDISVYKNEAARRLTSEKEAKNGVILLTVDKSTFQKLKRTVKKEVKEKSKKQGNKNRSGKAELKQSSPVFDKFDFIAFDLSNEGTPEMFWEMMQGVNRDLKIKFLVDEEVKSTWLLKNLKEVGLSNFVTLDVMKSEYVRRNTDYDIEGYDAIIHLKK